MIIDPAENRAQFLCTMIENIKIDQGAEELAVFDAWFFRVQSMLGNKATIDSAMCSLVLHLLGKAKKDDNLIGNSRAMYGQSLAALQKALNHPTEWKSSETLGAAMLCCMFEVGFQIHFGTGSTANDSWCSCSLVRRRTAG
jgi:hypothetical protein